MSPCIFAMGGPIFIILLESESPDLYRKTNFFHLNFFLQKLKNSCSWAKVPKTLKLCIFAMNGPIFKIFTDSDVGCIIFTWKKMQKIWWLPQYFPFFRLWPKKLIIFCNNSLRSAILTKYSNLGHVFHDLYGFLVFFRPTFPYTFPMGKAQTPEIQMIITFERKNIFSFRKKWLFYIFEYFQMSPTCFFTPRPPYHLKSWLYISSVHK